VTSAAEASESNMGETRFLDGLKKYLIVRWKKRWPTVPALAIWAFFCKITLDEKRSRGCFLIAAIVVIVGILFPFRWGGEDWDDLEKRN
jgi:hypothetical protein